jgi:murein DD-endopeptidase MepM/ murein hydrolase activator NlpD
LTWQRPSPYTYFIDFSGVPGQSATHEGADYVHDDPGVSEVTVSAAADGIVVYVRTGCTQSSTFASNTSLRECGSGWGNHVVVDHGGSHTRYAHLAPEQVWVQVGEQVKMGDGIGLMGNSGRSEVRHLHFELGTTSVSFEPCDSAQSFELVYNPELLF